VATSTPNTPAAERTIAIALALVDEGENVRPLDLEHVERLAASIKLRGLISPLTVRPVGERFQLVAGHHRLAACRALELEQVPVTIREQEATSADAAAENILRRQLTPLGEAKAVQSMLEDGYTLDGAATALGWSRKLVAARQKILELPEVAQRLLDDGRLPVSAVETLLRTQTVSPELAVGVCEAIEADELAASQLTGNAGWAFGQVLRGGRVETFAAYLDTVRPGDIEALRLGKKVMAVYAEADKLHQELDRYAYGPPQIRFNEHDVDQARAAGVLLELERTPPIICDRDVYRELVKQAIVRTRDTLAEAKAAKATSSSQRPAAKRERTPREQLDAEHRANLRDLTVQAHGVNLDLGAALMQQLASVDPADMDVARFFAYGLIGPQTHAMLGTRAHTARRIAANGIRLVVDEHRTTVTPTCKDGSPGKTKVTYGEVDDAMAWLWKFLDGAKSAGELYGRAMVCFAAQHYAHQLVLAVSKRDSSALPSSHNDKAAKAFAKVTKAALPGSHKQLQRALEREARDYRKRVDELQRQPAEPQADDEPSETAQPAEAEVEETPVAAVAADEEFDEAA